MSEQVLRPVTLKPITLGKLLEQIPELSVSEKKHLDTLINGVCSSSLYVQKGDIYVAIAGAKTHGAKYASAAIASGAVAVITDVAGETLIGNTNVPLLVCDNPREILGLVSAVVYRTTEIKKLGVTGTNGKTTTTFMVDKILQLLAQKTAITTTIERRIGAQKLDSELTTPEADALHAMIARAKELDTQAMAIEVSAHALTWKRVNGLQFDSVGFLNFSQDHLDDYSNLTEYYAAKTELFTSKYTKTAVVCVDDIWGQKLASNVQVPLQTVSVAGNTADWKATNITCAGMQTSFVLTAPNGMSQNIRVNLPGVFTAQNASVAIAMVHAAGWSIADVFAAVKDGLSVTVPGRLECVSPKNAPQVFLDYAHTPEAIRELLGALRPLTTGKLIAVLGADGERDTDKRPAMGQISAAAADKLIITDYNPRNENPEVIRKTLLDAALTTAGSCEIVEIANQRTAIHEAIKNSDVSDTVVIIGPGHEEISYVGNEKIPFSARSEARYALADAGWI